MKIQKGSTTTTVVSVIGFWTFVMFWTLDSDITKTDVNDHFVQWMENVATRGE